jgi:short-subunit dehydrogenase
MTLEHQRILVTGASSGIGEALAWELARRGAACVLAARRVHRLEALADRIAAAVPGAARPIAVACDVSDRASVAAAVRAATARLGFVDVLVNNAGVSAYGETGRTSPRDLADLLDVNFLGAVHAMQAVLPSMRRRGRGRIVNVASLAAIHGVPYLAAYSASKAALAAYSQSLRAEVARDGVTVQVIYPGYTETGIFAAERQLGGARRPPPPYAPADRVARRIVDAMVRGRAEVHLDHRGRLMAFLHGAMPRLLDRVMSRMAVRLGDSEVIHHAQA